MSRKSRASPPSPFRRFNSSPEVIRPGTAPQGTGQGRELIEEALPYQLGARTSFAFEEDGVHCTISLPVSASIAAVEEAHA